MAQQLFPGVAKPSVLLLTYGDDPSKIKGLKSPFINLGLGKRYVDTFSKFEALGAWLRKERPSDSDLICFVDGYDVVQRRTDLDEFVTRFKEFGADLVFGAETHCWPSPWMAHLFEPSPTKYKYPNCGTYVGYVWAVRKMIEWDEYRMSFDDQGLVHDFYLRAQAPLRLALDYRQTLFQTGTFVPWSDLDASQAWFVHFNGKSHLARDGSCVLAMYSRGEPIGGLRQLHRVITDSAGP
jgi:hypothetical protein